MMLAALASPPRVGRLAAGWLVLLAAGGCQTTHDVHVDALGQPGKSAGAGYRLEVRPPRGPVDAALTGQVVAAMEAALAAHGYFPLAAPQPPELVISLEYGVGAARLIFRYQARDMLAIDLWGKAPPQGGATPATVFDKFLVLTARAPAAGGAGPERWSVRVQLEDEGTDFAPALPVLTAVVVDYIDRHEAAEKTVRIKEAEARRAVRQLRGGGAR